MLYQISRGGQTYGPYTLADLKRYVESSHILLSDLAKSEEMPEWLPVSRILDPSGVQSSAPPAAEPIRTDYGNQPAYPPMAQFQATAQFQDPPNLHWGLVLLFDLLTAKLFQMVWNLILAAWMKRVQSNSNALLYYAAGYVLGLINTIMYIPDLLQQMQHVLANDRTFHAHIAHRGLFYLIALAAWVFKLVARFDMKSSLEEHFNTVEPIGLRMSGVLTFFFGGLYIQSQLNRINDIKRATRYGQYGR